MMEIRDLEAANKLLMRYVPLAKDLLGRDITLERMWPLLTAVGNPHERLKVVHVAGTSGKTSTAYYAAALLKETGASVGMTVSPHIDSVTERIQINGEPISDKDFCDYLGAFMDLIGDMQPTYFELLIAFAYWVFDKRGLDYAVMETGLGGLQDSTNVAQRSDKVCVITDIGFDHVEILGNTLELIAAQKAGIIHNHNEVFMYDQTDEIMRSIKARVDAKQARLNVLKEPDLNSRFEATVTGMPLFQRHNWLLARAVVEFIITRDSLSEITAASASESEHVLVPARMETHEQNGKTIVMDGAHNQQKMAAFVASLRALYPNQKAVVMLALKKGKDYQSAIDELLPVASKLILTTFNSTQDMNSVSIDPKELAKYCDRIGQKNYEAIEESKTAYQTLIKSSENLLVVTGSLYLVGQFRNR